MRKIFILILLWCLFLQSKAQLPADSAAIDTLTEVYQAAFNAIEKQLSAGNGSFKEAVFETENAYFMGRLNKEEFYSRINTLVSLCKSWKFYNPLPNYKHNDSVSFHNNLAIFTVLKDTVKVQLPDGEEAYHLPYSYDFNDLFGRERWHNMFVSKLLATKKGNCHSLPYLYKIIANELGATCWLGLAPNHIYIKNRCRQSGWYNTELTSGTFPIDAWVTASGYIPLQAIQNGIYMDTLSNKQAIALCVLDLAKGYEFQTKNYYDGFILKCCNLVLKHHPVNIQAMLLKAETLKRAYEKMQAAGTSDMGDSFKEMEALYIRLVELGYREMPESMYMKWLSEVNKFSNKSIPGSNPKRNTTKAN